LNQNWGECVSVDIICGSNKMRRPRTLQDLWWKLTEPYFHIKSFHDLMIFIGLLTHRICQYVNFCFWGYLKSRVYKGKPWILEDLKIVISEKIKEIDLKFLNRVDANVREILQTYIRKNGQYLSDIIFHT